jgi:hypothetical protein
MVAAGSISSEGMAAGATGMGVAMAAIGMGVAGTGAIGMEVAGMGAHGTEDHIGTDGRPTGGGITLATRIALMPITIPKLRTL